jgi:hypothetical protein
VQWVQPSQFVQLSHDSQSVQPEQSRQFEQSSQLLDPGQFVQRTRPASASAFARTDRGEPGGTGLRRLARDTLGAFRLLGRTGEAGFLRLTFRLALAAFLAGFLAARFAAFAAFRFLAMIDGSYRGD